jgi:hypothetical protein
MHVPSVPAQEPFTQWPVGQSLSLVHALSVQTPLVHEKYAGQSAHVRGAQLPDEHVCVGGQSPSVSHGG